MGFTLTFLSWWTPKYILNKQLDVVSNSTTEALKELLKIHSPNSYNELVQKEETTRGSLEKKRAAMARRHTELVAALVKAVGKEKAVKLGREKMFEVGKGLGAEIRSKLEVAEDPKDLVKAAKLLYRILGIDFDIKWLGKTNASLSINRCALSKEYTEITCLILSATDEGVINGLQPKSNMTFKNKITDGSSRCVAEIKFS